MALTQLEDIVYGPLFLPATIQRTTILSTIRTSGIAVDDPEISRFAQAPGNTCDMPFWNDITGDSNVSSDQVTDVAVAQQIVESQDIARKLRRNNGFMAANLVTALLTEDPLSVISQLIAEYWVREEQKILIAILNGVFAASSMAGNVHNIAAVDTDGVATSVTPETMSDALSLLGDHGQLLTAVMMHSRIYWNLNAARALTVGRDPVTGQEFTDWEGRRVIVNDQCVRTLSSPGAKQIYQYTSYLFGQGALAYAECTGLAGPKTPVEVFSQPMQGNGEGVDQVWYRRHFVMHPRGVKFVGTTGSGIAGESASNAELANGANWVRVYDPKNIRVVEIITNG
jgi:hypothetical protein